MPPTSSSFSSAQSSNPGQVESPSPLHAVIIFLITTLGGYAQVQYQSGKLSAFDNHGNIISADFLTLSLYALGLMAEFKLQNQLTCIPIMKRNTPLVGILVVVLLLIILFPLLGLAAFIIWALLVVDAAIRLLQEFVQWFFRMTRIHFHTGETVTNNFEREESGSPGIEENGLPV